MRQIKGGGAQTRAFSFSLLSVAGEAENGEVHFSIGAALAEVRKVAEVVGLAVLDDEYGAGLQHLRMEHKLRNAGKVGQIVGRVGKNDVEFRAASFDKLKGVAFHLNEVGVV